VPASVETPCSLPFDLSQLPSSEKSSVRESPRRKLTRPPPSRREESPRSLSSSETTPEPPTTPSSGPEFRCKGEGFFAHPSNCKKYYWCLDTPNQGMVAHTFSCPQGLFFNQITDGCDFLRNVDCGDKSTKETITKKPTVITEEPLGETKEEDEDDVEDPKSLKDILEIVKAAGGVEGLEKQIEEEEQSKKEEEDRRVRISSRTRNRLNKLLKGGQQKKPQRAEETSPSPQTRAPPTLPRRPGTTSKPPASIRTSLLSRLANRRRTTLSSPTQRTPGDKIENQTSEAVTSTPTTTRSFRRKTSLFRNRSRFSSRKTTTPTTRQTRPKSFSNLRSRFRNILSRTSTTTTTLSTTTLSTTTPVQTSISILSPETTQDPLLPIPANTEPEDE
jgi:hypothetical protein